VRDNPSTTTGEILMSTQVILAVGGNPAIQVKPQYVIWSNDLQQAIKVGPSNLWKSEPAAKRALKTLQEDLDRDRAFATVLRDRVEQFKQHGYITLKTGGYKVRGCTLDQLERELDDHMALINSTRFTTLWEVRQVETIA
jgi:ribosomal protein RSM22 (predicted rRNA methylase)